MITNISQIFHLIKKNILILILSIIIGYLIGLMILNLKFYYYKEPRPSFSHNIILKKNSLYNDIATNYPTIAVEINNLLKLFTIDTNINVLLDAKLPNNIKDSFNKIAINQKPDHVIIEINSYTDKVDFSEFFADFFNENIRNAISKDRIMDSILRDSEYFTDDKVSMELGNQLELKSSYKHNIILKKNNLYTNLSNNYPEVAEEMDNFLNLFTVNVNAGYDDENINGLLDAILPNNIKDSFNKISIYQKPDYIVIEIDSDTDKVDFSEFFADFFNENIRKLKNQLELKSSYKHNIILKKNNLYTNLSNNYPEVAEEMDNFLNLFTNKGSFYNNKKNDLIYIEKDSIFLPKEKTTRYNNISGMLNAKLPESIKKKLNTLSITQEPDYIVIEIDSDTDKVNFSEFFADFFNENIRNTITKDKITDYILRDSELVYNRSIVLKKNPSLLDMKNIGLFNDVENIINLYNVDLGTINPFLRSQLPDNINKDLVNIYISNQSDFVKISLLSNNPDINYGSFFSDLFNKNINKLFKIDRLKTVKSFDDSFKNNFYDQVINSLQNENFMSVLYYNDDVVHFLDEAKYFTDNIVSIDDVELNIGISPNKVLYKSIKDSDMMFSNNLFSKFFKQKDLFEKLEKGEFLEVYLSDVKIQEQNLDKKGNILEETKYLEIYLSDIRAEEQDLEKIDRNKDFLNNLEQKLEEGKYLEIYLSDVRPERFNFPPKPPKLELILPFIYSILSFLALLLILINFKSSIKIKPKE